MSFFELVNTPITLPLWLVVLLLLATAWALLDRLLLPSVRWLLRRRVNRVIDGLNKRLDIKLQPFKLTRRKTLLDRLIFDPQVMAAADSHAAAQEMPRAVVMATVRRYADEIVPAFNAYTYFRFGYWLSRRIARLLYRVRLGFADEEGLAQIPPNTTVVFLMNHRSNMDYILVSYIVAGRSALSYAVGEWARIWPLDTLIRSMGAYFVRRRSRNALYRKVLQRYVQMATAAGVTQAVYPEGGLSRDGSLQAPKLGLLDYMLRDFEPQGERDIVFIPVGINYDRTLEDRTLLRDLDPTPAPQGHLRSAGITVTFLARLGWLMASRRFHRFGYACVNLGTPISVKNYLKRKQVKLKGLEKEARFKEIALLGSELMTAIGKVVPVLPVSLVASTFIEAGDRALSELEVKVRVQTLAEELEERGAKIYIPREDRDYAIVVGLRMLTLRHLIQEEHGLYKANPEDRSVLRYYANSIAHFSEESLPSELP
ncbi:MAG: 1-acyl-sn-glycerol-3-phosphate acyltransferase [Deltaproteobacteria bacterium]|nr:1-acyl-sn-glycerol-3-phosphate acyltransferase [Deltaproteobacteria bacterium]